MSKAELLNRITVLYGGRAAEEIVFGDVTTGAQDDINKATDLARRMVTEFGMSKKVGAINDRVQRGRGMGTVTEESFSASEGTAKEIEREVRRILHDCHERAQRILVENRALLEEMSAYLLEHEVLDGDIMKGYLARSAQAESLEDRPTAEWVPTPLEDSG